MPIKRKPAYLLHKPTGQARVRIDSKDVYLGKFGSKESKDRYDDLVAEWLAKSGDASKYSLTIDDLYLLYVDFSDTYYRGRNGQPTSEVACVKYALRQLVKHHGTTRAREFSPRKFKEVRQAMVDAGRCRTAINRDMHRIKRVFKWAVENEYIPADVHVALSTVAGLKQGRSAARESEPVRPVAEGTVTNTLPFLSPVVQAMVRLQLITGARPGEICTLRPCDVTRGIDGVWVYRPEFHKTAHHGKERRIFIGPEGQAILAPYLERPADSYCFSPAESETLRRSENHSRRTTPVHYGNAPGTNRKPAPKRSASDSYTRTSYARAIVRACELAFGMPDELRTIDRTLPDSETKRLRQLASEWRAKHCWSPNRLRHSRATAIRERFGIEAAQVVLGHSDPRVTEIYAERDFEAAARIMREIG